MARQVDLICQVRLESRVGSGARGKPAGQSIVHGGAYNLSASCPRVPSEGIELIVQSTFGPSWAILGQPVLILSAH